MSANAITITADMAQAVSDHEARRVALGQADFRIYPTPRRRLSNPVHEGRRRRAAYGLVSGYFAPSVGFKMGLPAEWNGRSMEVRLPKHPQKTVIAISHLVPVTFCLLIMSKTTEAQSLPADSDIQASAQCVSAERRNDRRLAFGMRRRIQTLSINIGDQVTPGMRLARLNCNGAEADLQIAAAELEVVRTEYEVKKGAARAGELDVAEARLRATQVALQDAEATHTPLRKLARNGGVVLQTELSEAARRWANAELAVVIAQSSVERIRNPLSEAEHEYWRRRQKAREAAVRRTQLQVGYCDLRAPVAGVVDEVLHYEGEFVDAMEPVVVLRVEKAVETQGKESARGRAHEKGVER